MSLTEWKLWGELRGRQIAGYKFRRQVPIGPYFVDFACLEAKLVVEVDGDHHAFQSEYDARRDDWLGNQGFRVFRFWASEIDHNLGGVLEEILDALYLGPPPTSPRCAEGGYEA